jgi:putative lipoprotein
VHSGSKPLALLFAIAACAGSERAGAPAAPTTIAYDCENLQFTARFAGSHASLWLPGRILKLDRAPAASGAKYTGDGALFWSKGDQALLQLKGQTYRGCARSAARTPWEDARLRGVSFRAVGNEPGWSLELQPHEQIAFSTDYGKTRVATPVPQPQIESQPARATYRASAEGHELTLVIEPGPCQDSMSGETFEMRATVVLDGRLHRGCGRPLDR